MAFDSIPDNVRTPGVIQEENARSALSGTFPRPLRGLLVGMNTVAATIAEAVKVATPDGDSGDTQHGRGSMLAQMVWGFLKQNPRVEIDTIGLDPAAGTNATEATVFTGTATAAGTVALQVCGRRIEIPVVGTETASEVGDLIDTELALAKHGDLGVGTANTAGSVAWTATDDGTHGNFIRIIVSPRDTDSLPTGLGITAGDEDLYLASGATDPDLDTALAVVGSQKYEVVVIGLMDTTNWGKAQDWMATQWGYSVKKEGHLIVCYSGTFANTQTAGNLENSKHMTVLGPSKIPQLPWQAAAVMGGRIAQNWAVDPNRPMQNTNLVEAQEGLYGIDAPKDGDAFTDAQIETILTDGITPLSYEVAGKPKIVRSITSYQTNAAAVPDTSYLDTVTMLNLMNIFYQTRTMLGIRFPNHKAAADGQTFTPGTAVVQPSSLSAALLNLYDDMLGPAWVEDAAGYATDLSITYPGGASETDRFDVVAKPRLVQGARVFAFQHQFKLGAA